MSDNVRSDHKGGKPLTHKSNKYEIAREIGIPLKNGDNGDLTSKEAGKIGGKIGGNMVRDMVKFAEQRLKK